MAGKAVISLSTGLEDTEKVMIAFLVAVHGVQRLRSPWRWLLLAYPALMSLALVYFAEHYVVDIVAGAVLALAVVAVAGLWERQPGVGPGQVGTVRE